MSTMQMQTARDKAGKAFLDLLLRVTGAHPNEVQRVALEEALDDYARAQFEYLEDYNRQSRY